MKPKEPITPDWERIELDYRAGIKSTREIGSEHGLTHAGINKRAKKEGWDRDLKTRIHAKADAIVSKRVARMVSKEQLETDTEVVAVNADHIASIRISQQGKINTGIELVDLLTAQLIDIAGQRDDFEQIIEEITAEDKTAERAARLMKAVSLPTHASTAGNLANALKTLVSLQREAYGITSGQADPDGRDSPARGTNFVIVRP